ncbi:MAG: SCP2 sterol-binding domain-containing protein [Anaerolineaceae bacterium]|nr:SCP2 sterol-binding domain-containing protein [Anaerolineaceae bacterium]
MVDITVKKLIDVLPKVFISENAKNIRANIQITATGTEGGEWGICIIDQTCSVKDGQIENPDFSLIATSDDILKIFLGELDPLRAYMQGKIQFKGRIKHALEITDLFSTDKSKIEALI